MKLFQKDCYFIFLIMSFISSKTLNQQVICKKILNPYYVLVFTKVIQTVYQNPNTLYVHAYTQPTYPFLSRTSQFLIACCCRPSYTAITPWILLSKSAEDRCHLCDVPCAVRLQNLQGCCYIARAVYNFTVDCIFIIFRDGFADYDMR